MAKPKDIKIIGEIKSKVKVIELKEEEQVEEQEKEEEPLEDLVMDAPSAREFPEFSMLGGQGVQESEQRQEVIQTPSATTEEENKNAVRYQVQRDVSEEEIARTYRTEVSAARPIMLNVSGPERNSREGLANRELESLRNPEGDNKYKLSSEPEKQTKKRKYPWE